MRLIEAPLPVVDVHPVVADHDRSHRAFGVVDEHESGLQIAERVVETAHDRVDDTEVVEGSGLPSEQARAVPVGESCLQLRDRGVVAALVSVNPAEKAAELGLVLPCRDAIGHLDGVRVDVGQLGVPALVAEGPVESDGQADGGRRVGAVQRLLRGGEQVVPLVLDPSFRFGRVLEGSVGQFDGAEW